MSETASELANAVAVQRDAATAKMAYHLKTDNAARCLLQAWRNEVKPPQPPKVEVSEEQLKQMRASWAARQARNEQRILDALERPTVTKGAYMIGSKQIGQKIRMSGERVREIIAPLVERGLVRKIVRGQTYLYMRVSQ